MAIHVAIVEDEKKWQKELYDCLERYGRENSVDFEIDCFSDGIGITTEYKGSYDIIFMDIQMRIQDGMTAARQIRELDEDVILIFVTSMAQYAIQGYSVGAFNFVLKPIDYTPFSHEMDRVRRKLGKDQHTSLLIRSENGHRRIPVREIRYVEHIQKRLFIYTGAECFNTRMSLSDLEKELNDHRFFCPHSGYLINLNYVEAVESSSVHVAGTTIPLSRYRRSELLEQLSIIMRNRIL